MVKKTGKKKTSKSSAASVIKALTSEQPSDSLSTNETDLHLDGEPPESSIDDSEDGDKGVEKKTEKKRKGRQKKNKDNSDPFDAWVAAAQEKWPGSVEKASNLPVDGTPVMSTGNYVLDRMTYGGLRRGRLYRFWGLPKSTKTGSALNCAEAFTNNHCGRCFEHRLKCRCDGEFVYAKCLYVDVEGRISDNRPWSESHGINPDRLVMVSPKGGEQVVDIADAALRSSSGIGLVVIDSLAQMTSADEIMKPTEKGKTIGRNAMLINSAMRKWICSLVSKDINSTNKPTIITINQLRQNIGMMKSPDVMPGGLGQGYTSACDIKFTKKAKHYLVSDGKGGFEDKVIKYGSRWEPDEDDTVDFIEVEVRVTDSGICPPGRYGMFHYWLRAGHGRRVGDTDNTVWLWEYAKRYELLKKTDKGYTLAGLESRTAKEMENLFQDSVDAQERVWVDLMGILSH